MTGNTQDYSIPTVGQSRLAPSFSAINVTRDSQPTEYWAQLRPLNDPRMKAIADITVVVQDEIVGYLRPPALNRAAAEIIRRKAAALEVPVLVVWGSTGPETWIAPFDEMA